MNIKKGDNIIVITGTDRGKTGKVERVFPLIGKILVEGVNVKKRHQRKTKSNQKGQILNKSMPIDISNVMILDSSKNKRTRIGHKMVGDKKVRISIKSGKEI